MEPRTYPPSERSAYLASLWLWMSESYYALRWLETQGVIPLDLFHLRRIALLLSSVPAEEQDAVQEFAAPREP